MSAFDALNYNNPVFRVYVTWSGLLLIKLLLMAPLTSFHRMRNNAFENPEDISSSSLGAIRKDDKVERVRRAHLNDLENIPAFIIAGLFYVMTFPNVYVASWLIRIAAFARICHTIVYAIYLVRQPARGIFFALTALITMYMTITSIVHFFNF